MKIIIIASLYKPYTRGGAEIMAQTVIDELKKKHEVVVITISPWKGLASLYPIKTNEDDVDVYRFYPLNVFSFIDINAKPFFLRFFWHVLDILNIHSAWTVFKIIRQEKPDVVMMHAVKGMGYTVPFAVQKAGIFNICTVHDVQFVVPSGQYMWGEEARVKKSLTLRIYRSLTRVLFGSPDFVIYPSQFLKNFYDAYDFFKKSKKILLPNPIETHTFDREISTLQENGPVTFLYLGQLEKHKGILFLLEVFKKWRMPDVRLMIAGSGSCEDVVRETCHQDSRISFLGYMTGDAREELFQKAHYLIMPSLCYENAPLVIGEALSRGIPAIVAKIGGAYELIGHRKNGWVFAPNDGEDCARVLSEAHTVARMGYQELSLCAKESVKEYVVEDYCEQLLTIAKDHIGATGGTGGKISK